MMELKHKETKPNHPSYFQNGTFNLSHIHNSAMISMSTQFLHSNVLSVGPLTKLSTSLVFHLHRTLSAFLIFSLSHSHSLGTGVFIISFGNRVTRCNIEIKKTKREKKKMLLKFSHTTFTLCALEKTVMTYVKEIGKYRKKERYGARAREMEQERERWSKSEGERVQKILKSAQKIP